MNLSDAHDLVSDIDVLTLRAAQSHDDGLPRDQFTVHRRILEIVRANLPPAKEVAPPPPRSPDGIADMEEIFRPYGESRAAAQALLSAIERRGGDDAELLPEEEAAVLAQVGEMRREFARCYLRFEAYLRQPPVA